MYLPHPDSTECRRPLCFVFNLQTITPFVLSCKSVLSHNHGSYNQNTDNISQKITDPVHHIILHKITDIPILHNCLHNRFTPGLNLLHADFFLLVKVKAEQITLILVKILEVLDKLFFPSGIVLIAMPDL